MTKTVIILRGASGSGKSTWTAKHAASGVVCSADTFMHNPKTGAYEFSPAKLGWAHKSCLAKFEDAVKRGEELVVVDNTNIKPAWYKDYVALAQSHGYQVFQKVMSGSFQNAHGVPGDKVQQMRDSFVQDTSLPHYEERA